ncbi:SDR family oxidoreductase [Chloroflexi bacterium TSY]|nr:SDR family oxidoreductase [Chloroflexi bacterium TSY]
MITSLTNKRILVTGASSGIGAGIAKAFGASGAQVLIQYRCAEAGAQRVAEQVNEAGGSGSIVHADLRSEMAIDRIFAHIDKTWGGIDVLVNNAGVVHKGSALDTTSDYWNNTININLRAPYLLCRHAARRMIKAGNCGSIVNVTSVAGTRSGMYVSAYAASKAALDALTRSLATEWAQYGIRVNAVAPGVVPVERQQERLYAAQEQWMEQIPLGRFGTPGDIGALVIFLASDSASWITGQTYIIDGGALARSGPPGPPPDLPVPPPLIVDN